MTFTVAVPASMIQEGKELSYLKPAHVFPLNPDPAEVIATVEALFE